MNYNSEEKNMLKAAVLSTMILSVFFFFMYLPANRSVSFTHRK